MTGRFEALVSLYADGGARPEEMAELEALLRRDATCRGLFVDRMRLEADLRELFTSRAEGAIEVERADVASRDIGRGDPAGARLNRRRRGAGGARFRRPALIGGLAAAGLLLSAVFPLRDRPIASRPAVPGAEITAIEGSADVSDPRGRMPALPGSRVTSGQTVKIGPRARVVLRCDDGTTLELSREAEVRFRQLDPAKDLWMARGALHAAVAGQAMGAGMVIATPQGEARVVGTRFTLIVMPPVEGAMSGSARLEVIEGRVRLTRAAALSGTGAPESIEVGGGEFAMAKAGIDLVSRKIAAVGGRDAGEVQVLAGGWKKLLTMGEEPAGPPPRVRSQRVTGPQTDPYFQPDEVIMLQDPRLVKIPERLEIALRIRSEKAGKAMVTLAPDNPVCVNENNGSKRVPIGPETREIRLRAANFTPFMSSRPLRPGMWIAAFGIWGFGAGRITLEQVTVRSGAD